MTQQTIQELIQQTEKNITHYTNQLKEQKKLNKTLKKANEIFTKHNIREQNGI